MKITVVVIRDGPFFPFLRLVMPLEGRTRSDIGKMRHVSVWTRPRPLVISRRVHWSPPLATRGTFHGQGKLRLPERSRQQPEHRRLQYGGGLVDGVQLGHGLADVKIDRALRNIKDIGDFTGGLALAGPAKHFHLPAR